MTVISTIVEDIDTYFEVRGTTKRSAAVRPLYRLAVRDCLVEMKGGVAYFTLPAIVFDEDATIDSLWVVVRNGRKFADFMAFPTTNIQGQWVQAQGSLTINSVTITG
jgi:hypothetical protein